MSVTDDNSGLVGSLASFSIKETNVGPTVEGEADSGLLPGRRLLNGEVYHIFQSQTTVSKKRHRSFWGLRHLYIQRLFCSIPLRDWSDLTLDGTIHTERQTQAREYRQIWLKQYKKQFPHTKLLHKPTSRYYRRILAPTVSYEPDSSPMFDEFEHCCQASTTSLPSGPPILERWISNEAKYPKLTSDVHSIPAISVECERVFSSAGQLIC